MITSPKVPKQRLDHYLAEQYTDISRAFLQKLCTNDQVLVNGQPKRSGFKLKPSDKIEVLYDMAGIEKIEDIDLPILYQDKDVLVINKPAGVISHSRGKYWNEPSVASFIRQKTNTDPLSGVTPRKKAKDGVVGGRAGIVHRLDRATSGIMICAKTQPAMAFLQNEFADRKVIKTYIAIVSGHLNPTQAIIDMPIERNPKAPSTFRAGPNGKVAQTQYKVTKSFKDYDLVHLEPRTGRTHQLRVHMQQQKHPIVGDTLYGGESHERLMLHACKLKIKLPSGKIETFSAPIPTEFDALMSK